MHGQNIFSATADKSKQYTYLYRGRMDGRIDLVRALRDKQFKYIHNYMPHRPNGQHLGYLWKAASVRSWEQACQQNRCNKAQQRFWKPRPAEELYDIEADPWEVNNLAHDSSYNKVLLSMRKDLMQKNRHYKDVGFIPEGELSIRTQDITGYELVRQDNFPIDLVIATAEIASLGKVENTELLIKRLSHPEASVRYWAAIGFSILKEQALPAKKTLLRRLNDSSADVQIAAAEALVYLGLENHALPIMMKQLRHESPLVRIHAANALNEIGNKASAVVDELQAMVTAMEKLKAEGKLQEEKYLLPALSHTVSKLHQKTH